MTPELKGFLLIETLQVTGVVVGMFLAVAFAAWLVLDWVQSRDTQVLPGQIR